MHIHVLHVSCRSTKISLLNIFSFMALKFKSPGFSFGFGFEGRGFGFGFEGRGFGYGFGFATSWLWL